jgi:NAD(P)-dependent dehydrogenase (short-subunit alcohol dehydrogenase family)
MAESAVVGLRIAVVGGSSGVGEALVAQLRDRGARVAVVDVNPAAEIVADIAKPDDCARAMAEAIAALDGLDGLAITAGLTGYAPIAETDAERWEHTLQVNLIAAGLLTRAALPALLESEAASIVVTASAAGRRGYSDFTAYSSSKAGLIHWSGAAARELGPQGIRVNCVSPGPVDTPMLRGPRPAAAERQGWADNLARRTSLGRIGQPNEVAEAIGFLLGRRASFITGALLDVDGGETA